jgi:uncharacterized membrane protein
VRPDSVLRSDVPVAQKGEWVDSLAALLGSAAVALIAVGIVLFVVGLVIDVREPSTAEGKNDFLWLIKKTFAILMGGRKYRTGQRVMAGGILVMAVGIAFGLAALGTVAAAALTPAPGATESPSPTPSPTQ